MDRCYQTYCRVPEGWGLCRCISGMVDTLNGMSRSTKESLQPTGLLVCKAWQDFKSLYPYYKYPYQYPLVPTNAYPHACATDNATAKYCRAWTITLSSPCFVFNNDYYGVFLEQFSLLSYRLFQLICLMSRFGSFVVIHLHICSPSLNQLRVWSNPGPNWGLDSLNSLRTNGH